MRCPSCRKSSQVAQVKYFQLGQNNQLEAIDSAMLTCGCVVRLADVKSSKDVGWEAVARKRLDDNLRSVFG